MQLGLKTIGNFKKPYVIAEIGSNHGGDMNQARKHIDAAKASGADCVKFQSWTKSSLFSKVAYASDKTLEIKDEEKGNPSLEELIDLYSISENELIEVRDYANEVGIDFATTPFCNQEVDFMSDELGCLFIKIASMDLNNYPFLEYVAKKQKPIVLSTGLADLEEIKKAVHTIEGAGNDQIILLHCVAIYPPEDSAVHLNNIDLLRDAYPQYAIGFSDHTQGTAIPLAAIAKGAAVIEKHFTLDHDLPGWDHFISANPEEMKTIVEHGARIHAALGSYERVVTASDIEKRSAFRRSLVASHDIRSGQVVNFEDLEVKRPGTGIPPEGILQVVGKKATRDIAFDEVLKESDFEC